MSENTGSVPLLYQGPFWYTKHPGGIGLIASVQVRVLCSTRDFTATDMGWWLQENAYIVA